MHSPVLSLLALLGVVASSPLSTYPFPPSDRISAADLPLTPVANPIPNSYIVILKDGISPATFLAHTNFVENIHAQAQSGPDAFTDIEHGLKNIYNSHMKGYAGTFSPGTIKQILARPEVDYVEPDQVVHTMNITTQNMAPWGLARLSHRERLGLGTFTRYVYDDEGGEGVDVYVIDTGIYIHHQEFEGRAYWGKTIPKNSEDIDGNGHGTHCAGTIASHKYGVAKRAHVIAVKVLGTDGSGTMSDVVEGVFWAADRAAEKAKQAEAELKATGRTNHKGSVANMSLGGGRSRALNDAVDGAVDSGLHFAVAAGNDNKDACDYSPAGAEKAVTVGASTIVDERAYFSNFGPCVDVFAPGLNIISTWTGSETARNTISGTSMASPHTAGLIAYVLSLYPSKFLNIPDEQFDSTSDSFFNTVIQTVPGLSNVQRILSVAKVILPKSIAERIPSFAPVPPRYPILSPRILKRTILSLASEGMLSNLGPDTPNLLIFNNATN
jgi:cerevisin